MSPRRRHFVKLFSFTSIQIRVRESTLERMVKIAKAKKSTHSRGKASKNLRTGKSLTVRKEEDPNAEWEIDVSITQIEKNSDNISK